MRCVKPEHRQRARRKGTSDPRDQSRHGCREFALLRGFLFLHVKCILWSPVGIRRLDLDLAEAVLPDGGERGDTVLAEVDQYVPRK